MTGVNINVCPNKLEPAKCSLWARPRPIQWFMIYRILRSQVKLACPCSSFFAAVQRHHLPRKALIYFASQNWTFHKWFSLSYLTSSLSVSTTKRSGCWFSEPRRCIARSILQTTIFNCFLSMTKKKKKKRNNFLVRQRTVNEIFLSSTSKQHAPP